MPARADFFRVFFCEFHAHLNFFIFSYFTVRSESLHALSLEVCKELFEAT